MDAKEKFFVTRTFTNHIAHRTLDSFERRNPSTFDLTKRKFRTWREAHAYVVETRLHEVQKLAKELANAQKRLQKAMQMKGPTTTDLRLGAEE